MNLFSSNQFSKSFNFLQFYIKLVFFIFVWQIVGTRIFKMSSSFVLNTIWFLIGSCDVYNGRWFWLFEFSNISKTIENIIFTTHQYQTFFIHSFINNIWIFNFVASSVVYPTSCRLVHPQGSCTPGIIEYIRLEGGTYPEPRLFVKLDSYNHEHYTNRTSLFAPIIDAFHRGMQIQWDTTKCCSGDHGFGTFILRRPMAKYT